MHRLALMLLLAVFPGCLLETLTVTAIQGELASQAAQSATHQLSQAEDEKARVELQQAVNSYAGFNGRFPASLDELAPSYLNEVPRTADGRAFHYDPATGKVMHPRAVDQGGAPAIPPMTAQDEQNLQALASAIRDFHTANGRIPTGLSELHPLYIAALPKMSNGQDYVYDPRTGGIYHPRELRAQAAQPAPAQPNRSGTAAGQIDNISSEHNRRQMQTLQDLDL
jgi:hypothetical protein